MIGIVVGGVEQAGQLNRAPNSVQIATHGIFQHRQHVEHGDAGSFLGLIIANARANLARMHDGTILQCHLIDEDQIARACKGV